MKHHLLHFMALLLLAVPALQAQMQEKKIIVSSLGTPEKAERALEQLQSYLEQYPDIVSLLDTNGIALHSRPSGKYFIVVIEPFSNKANLSKVKNTIQQRYPGLFVNNYTPETDVIVSESTAPAKAIIKEEVAMDMVTEKVPESLVIIKESEDAVPRVVAADKVEVPQVIALEKEALETQAQPTPKAAALIEKKIETNVTAVPEPLTEVKETVEAHVEQNPETADATNNASNVSQTVAIIKEKVVEEHSQKKATAHKAVAEHSAASTETAHTASAAKKETFISHNPDHQTQAHHSVFPPWWVLLSVLALILSPIGSYIESRNAKLHR